MQVLGSHDSLKIMPIILCLIMAPLGSLMLGSYVISAQSPTTLASTFAPVLHFTSDEKFYPTSVDYIIGSSVLKANGSSADVDHSPSPSTLGNYQNSSYYLDNKLGTLEAIVVDYASKANGLGFYTYVHV